MKHQITSKALTEHWLRVCSRCLTHKKLTAGQRETLQAVRKKIIASQVVTRSQIERIKQAKP